MAGHEFLDHAGETVLRLRSADLSGLFAEAAAALGELEQGSIPVDGRTWEHPLGLAADDLPSLLVDWLNELIYLSETGAAVPVSAQIEVNAFGHLEAIVALAGLTRRPALVKAATHHGLRLVQEPEGWVAEVTLDV